LICQNSNYQNAKKTKDRRDGGAGIGYFAIFCPVI